MAEVGVIGAGSWGIALAKLLHTNGNKVTVWSIVEDEIKMLQEKHEHVDKLPGVKLPEDIIFTTDLKETIQGKDVLVLAGGLPMLDMVRASSQSTAAADAPAELRLAAQKVTLTDAAAGSAVEVLYRMVRDAENLA